MAGMPVHTSPGAGGLPEQLELASDLAFVAKTSAISSVVGEVSVPRGCALHEFAQEVVAAFEQLAGDGDARAVPADPRGELVVVGPAGAARAPGGLRGLVERLAQRGWSVAGEMPRRASGV